MNNWLIRNAHVVNQGSTFQADVLVADGRIERIASEGIGQAGNVRELDAQGRYLLPGVIDEHVHFREPGLTQKSDLTQGPMAAVAGGVTSFMEMPNTKPPALSHEVLERKYDLAAHSSVANYSFYLGVGNDNIDEILRTDPKRVCGLKAYLGSSTGNLLVDREDTLARVFREAPVLLAVHTEDDATIRRNLEQAQAKYGDDIPMEEHPVIRSTEACWLSTKHAVAMAKEYGTRLHVAHVSTAREMEFFEPGPSEGKRITAEACVHHLWFTDADYARLGARIKWNPSIKTRADRDGLRQAVKEGRIDAVATDHAPHTWEEKQHPYTNCPSGAPLVQHALPAMLELMHQGVFTLEEVVEKMCHAPARLFQVKDRGFIREGQFADLVLVDLDAPWTVAKDNLLYKCGWSPFEGQAFRSRVLQTWVNGNLVYDQGRLDRSARGMRLTFNR